MSEKLKSIRTTLVLALLMFVGTIQAQTVKVNVKDSSGEAVIGASVIEKGTKNGGITDLDGNFTLKGTGKPIVISYIGMIAQEVTATGGDLKIVMQDDNASLDEVVVIGY